MAKTWEYFVPGLAQWRMTEDLWNGAKHFVGSTARELLTGKTDAERLAEEQASSSAQQEALTHAEQREDTAVQRRMADLQASGINPVLAGSQMGFADSGASQAAVYSKTQEQQVQAQQMQAMASLISSAAMLFMARGRGLPVVSSGSSAAVPYDLLANGKGLTKAERHAIQTYRMYGKI